VGLIQGTLLGDDLYNWLREIGLNEEQIQEVEETLQKTDNENKSNEESEEQQNFEEEEKEE